MPAIELEAGTIHYKETGPRDGRPVVFVHGFVMGGDLFDGLGDRLAAQGLRCFAPTWPFGAHTEPMRPGTDVTPRGGAAIIAAFLTALDLEDVVLLGNDSGGAVCQVVAVDHPERLGALVLTNCDMFDNFPPGPFKALVKAARVPGALRAMLAPMRTAAVRRSPMGFGALSHHDVDHLARGWVRPALTQPAVFEDLRRFTLGLQASVTQDAAARLPGFHRPVLLPWGTDDGFFPREHADRMAALLPDARVEAIPDSKAFSMIDQPDRLAELVGAFATRVAEPHAA